MATKTFRFLTRPQVQRLHHHLTDNLPTQPDMLESAIHSPMNMKHYGKVEDVFQLASNFAEKIMKNHAYTDGNKRTALLATDMFLKINGYYLQETPLAEDAHNQAIIDAHLAVVTNKWTAEELGHFYKSVAGTLTKMTPEIMEYRSQSLEC